MEFKIVDRVDHEMEGGLKREDDDRKCELCKINDWEYILTHDDDEGFEWIEKRTDKDDGYLLVCKDCLEKEMRPIAGWHYS